MNGCRAIGIFGLIGVLSAGCASSHDLTRDLPGIKFMKYTLAGAAREQGASLERGRTQLHAGEYDSAIRSLHHAIWEVELIDKPWLRLEELVEAHEGLAEAYAALGKKQWSEEQRALAQALVEYRRRGSGSVSPETALAKARAAYQAAHFREAVTAFGQALVELEGVSPTPVRVKALADARCHLMLAYFALGRPDRAAEEIRRLAGSDGATITCSRQAPPPVRTLIRAVETSEARSGKRSAE
jgi:tetratricopeptide (TPR) repeat protein